MDNAQKAIMIGVGLFITIIVIAAVMLITGIGQDLLTSGTSQVQDITDDLDKGTLDTVAAYNGKIVGGVQARSIARTAKKADATLSGTATNSAGTSVTISSPEDINAAKKYKIEVTYASGAATVKFTEQT